MQRHLKTSSVLALAAAVAATLPVTAQEAPAESEDAEIQLDVVTVTSQRREESLQDVSTSVSVLSDDALSDAFAVDQTDLVGKVPGLALEFRTASRSGIFIRGIGNGTRFDLGANQPVSTFIDDVYVPRLADSVGAFLDVDRVEVLRGPQGALFGRNTIAGALSLVTKDPTDEFEGELALEGGNQDTYRIDGLLSGPIAGEKLMARAAILYRTTDGFNFDEVTGEDAGIETSAARLKFKSEMTDRLTGELTFDYLKREQDATIFLIARVPEVNPGLVASPVFVNVGNERSAEFTTPGQASAETFTASGRLEWALDALDVVSITSFRDQESSDVNDLDASDADAFLSRNGEETEQFSQEIRLLSTPGGAATFGDRVDWILGAYYLSDEGSRTDTFEFGPESTISFGLQGIRATPGLDQAIVDAIGPSTRRTDVLGVNLDLQSFAVFGQMGVDLTERIKLIGALRYTDDKIDFDYSIAGPGTPLLVALTQPQFGVSPFDPGFALSDELAFDSVDPKVTLEYRPDDTTLIYGSFSTGYRSGGFQFATPFPDIARTPFEPEDLKAYELGIKAEPFDRRVRLNATAFFYEYDDLQQQIILVDRVPPATTIFNIGSAEVYGAEVEATWLATENLQLDGTLALLNTEVTSFEAPPAAVGLDLLGNELPRSPDYTISFGGSYLKPLQNGSEIVFRADYFYTDEYFFDVRNDVPPAASQDAYGLINGSLTWTSSGGGLDISAFVRNALDEEYNAIAQTSTLPVLAGAVEAAYPADGRTWGVRLRTRF